MIEHMLSLRPLSSLGRYRKISAMALVSLLCCSSVSPVSFIYGEDGAEVSDLVDEISSKAKADGIGRLDTVKEEEEKQRLERLSAQQKKRERLARESQEIAEKTKAELKILNAELESSANHDAQDQEKIKNLKNKIETSFDAQIENERRRREAMNELDKKEEERLKKSNLAQEENNKLMKDVLAALRQANVDMKYRKLKIDRVGREIVEATEKKAEELLLDKELTAKLERQIELNREERLKALEQSTAQEMLVREELFTMLRNLVREVPSFAQSLEKTVKDVQEFEEVTGEHFSTIKRKYQLSTSEMSALVQDMAGQLQRMFGMIRAARDGIAQSQTMIEYERRTGKNWFQRDDLLSGYRRIEEIIADRDSKLAQTVGDLRNEMRVVVSEMRSDRMASETKTEALRKENMLLKQKLGYTQQVQKVDILQPFEMGIDRKPSWSRISTLNNRMNDPGSKNVDVLLYDDFTNENGPKSNFDELQIMDFTEDEF
jgi:hypothetical protein